MGLDRTPNQVMIEFLDDIGKRAAHLVANRLSRVGPFQDYLVSATREGEVEIRRGRESRKFKAVAVVRRAGQWGFGLREQGVSRDAVFIQIRRSDSGRRILDRLTDELESFIYRATESS